MNDKKFCFIICANDADYLDECISYINGLNIPEGYDIDLLTIEDAASMAAGYNEAMENTDAKYKIYMHQDTFIVNTDILSDLLGIFEKNPQIGAVGAIGSDEFLANRVTNSGEVYGNVISVNAREKALLPKYRVGYAPKGRFEADYKKVDCIWGCFFATQIDVEWEELFENDWKYYAEIHSLSLKEKGYTLAIPKQDKPWVIHDGNNEGNSHKRAIIDAYAERFGKLIDSRSFKRILYMNTEQITIPSLAYEIYRLGYYMEMYFENIECTMFDESASDRLADWLKDNDYECVISYELAPTIAQASEKANVKYLSWAWDSPLLTHYAMEKIPDTSYVFTFDKAEIDNLKRIGIEKAYYLPLTTNSFVNGGLTITKEDEKKFSKDISFIGNLYDNDIILNPARYFGEEKALVAVDYLTNRICDYSDNIKFVKEFTDDLFEEYLTRISDDTKSLEYKRAYFELMFSRNIAHSERVAILNRIATKYPIDLFTKKGDRSDLKNVIIHGPVDSMAEMPKIFHLSKINLNLTLHSIKTGVPLRVFDIMGVGGFVLSNYQEELAELFVEDKEVVLFKNMDEMMDKIDYYLKHEDARSKIAMNGYKRVKKDYSHENALKKMFETAGIKQ